VLTVGSLFSGIGGFDLGLERAGMRVIWQSEIDPYASAVLKKHWPEVPNHGDIRTITKRSVFAALFQSYGADWRPDVICGGFPCQDISNAGKRAGIDGERSGLWSEFARVIGELRPRYVIVENVAALLGRGLERVLGDLAALGFDAEWHCIPASAIRAPHRRDRVWIVAVANGTRSTHGGEVDARRECGCGWNGLNLGGVTEFAVQVRHAQAMDEGRALDYTLRRRYFVSKEQLRPRRHGVELADWWRTEPDVGRVAHGVPSRVDRLRCLGNAIVPQVAEIIGRAIVSAHS
jgi:DNA (cytosine-5)-methyltransferase 1